MLRARKVAATRCLCRECAASVHAKQSSLGQRFFAHDVGSSCPASGESVAHRLLKTELAAAIRDAGWVAELEVPGTGWRADVLAASPDGARRVAWEAQLASATVADLQERTDTMRAELDAVCWVTDQDVPWMRQVPSLRLRRYDTGDGVRDQMAQCRCALIVGNSARRRPALTPELGNALSPRLTCSLIVT